MKKIDIIYLSDFIISYFNKSGEFISNKKLQKLLYYIQAWHLVYFEGKLIFVDKPEAWVHGPVYRVVYDKYKKFGYNPLKTVEYEFKDSDVFSYLDLKKDQIDLIREVLKKYAPLSAFQLEALTHNEKPWLEKREGLSDFVRCESDISFDTMKEYYSSLVN
ncbi:MAG TPA: type II toxin-antitoxin system antitoxin SocA domain-containing protein [Ferruginibacter sp.]|jgi:uncharacterized phage-associated protein|nr:type II toxin-antitoxin system antitoxin SocA domain-containing protein [Ferruginibacter sp.]